MLVHYFELSRHLMNAGEHREVYFVQVKNHQQDNLTRVELFAEHARLRPRPKMPMPIRKF